MGQGIVYEYLSHGATDGEEEQVLADGGIGADEGQSGSKFVA